MKKIISAAFFLLVATTLLANAPVYAAETILNKQNFSLSPETGKYGYANASDLEHALPEANTPTYMVFKWQAVEHAKAYKIQVFDSAGKKVFKTNWYSPDEVCSSNLCEVILPITLESGTYTWQVAARNVFRFERWSKPLAFTIQQEPDPDPTNTPEPTATTEEPAPKFTNTLEPTTTTGPNPEPTNSPEPTTTVEPTPEPTNTLEPTTTTIPTLEPTNTPEPTPTTIPTLEPTNTPEPTTTVEPTPEPTNTPEPPASARYVSPTGSDSNPGTEAKPWQTMKKAFRSIEAGDTLYMRGGVYETSFRGGYFENSGTKNAPITVTNYPGEQVEIRITEDALARSAFFCWTEGSKPTPKADYIRIIGTDVKPVKLGNGITSEKGIVVRGVVGDTIKTAGGAWIKGDCDYWELAGIHVMDTSRGFYIRIVDQETSPDHWYIHNNRIENYYGGSGIQNNGDYTTIENNQIYKVTNVKTTDFSCHHINLLGHHNIVRGNDLDAKGSTLGCVGILFEWDMSDYNLIENNRIAVYGWGTYGRYLHIAGGDNNIIRKNKVIGDMDEWYTVFVPESGRTAWPCNELTEYNARSIPPINDPSATDYEYFYEPRNCQSVGNQFYDNVYTKQ